MLTWRGNEGVSRQDAKYAVFRQAARRGDVKTTKILTAIIEREEDGYSALCPELDVASQGSSVEEARSNLSEAVGLFLECADAAEIRQRFKGEIFITPLEGVAEGLRVEVSKSPRV